MKIDQRGSAGIILTIILVVALIAIAVGGYLYWQSQNENDNTDSNNTTTTEKQPVGPQLSVEPMEGNTVSGVVTATLTNAPEGTKMVMFTMQGSGTASVEGPNLGIDNNESDGWSKLIDTTEYENGLYEIAGLPTISADGNPLAMTTTQIMIQN